MYTKKEFQRENKEIQTKSIVKEMTEFLVTCIPEMFQDLATEP